MITNTCMRGGIIGSFQGVRGCGSARKCIKTLFGNSKSPFVVAGLTGTTEISQTRSVTRMAA